MPKSLRQKGASNIFIVIVLFVILAVGAYFLYKNFQVNLKSGASNVVQSANGKLLKSGSKEFSTSCKGVITQYALFQPKVLAAVSGPGYVTGEPPPSLTPRPSAKPTAVPVNCLPLVVQAKLADPLVGQMVVVTGTQKNGTFYATSIKKLAKCVQQCPGKDNVLRNCNPPEIDGSSQDSTCDRAGRMETCGSNNYCCPSKGARWTTDLTKCKVIIKNSTCPGAEACPVSTQPSLLRSCHPSDADGTAQESLCNTAGRIQTCGANFTKYCCPKAGAAWTTNLSACPAYRTILPSARVTPTPVPVY